MQDRNINSEDQICSCGDPECPGSVPFTWPFKINAENTDDSYDGLIGYFSVRTSSFEWDGERTDLHDVLSLLLALILRVRDVASTQLLTELNPILGLESEIYARLIVLRQEGEIAPLLGRSYFQALSEQSRAAHDMVLDVFGVPAAGPVDPRQGGEVDNPALPAWVEAACKRLRLDDRRAWEFRHREATDWKVFTSLRRGVTIAEFGEERMGRLRKWLADFKPVSVEGMTRTAIRSEMLVNAVPNARLKDARAFLKMVEGTSDTVLVIPMDSHFAVVGRTALVAIAAPCGAEIYHSERVAAEARREAEADVFLHDVEVIWRDKLDDARFEALTGELLTRERGVLRVRQVGATREADDGRDFLVEWARPPVGLVTEGVTDGASPLLELHHVIVQVKIRSTGVGRHHLPGLRDTVEHNRCTGLLIVAYPNATSTLTDHLTDLRRNSRFWVDWWGRAEIERRCRRYPEIAARYTDLFTLDRRA